MRITIERKDLHVEAQGDAEVKYVLEWFSNIPMDGEIYLDFQLFESMKDVENPIRLRLMGHGYRYSMDKSIQIPQ